MTSFVKVLVICSTVCFCQSLVRGNPLDEDKGIAKIELQQTCYVAVSDMVIPIAEGENYTYRCDVYYCVTDREGNATLEEDIHECENTVPDWEFNLCQQWSDDGCCCEVVGCEDMHGEIQPKGEMYQTAPSPDPTRPECGSFCKCQAWPQECTIVSCH